jgi:uracil-DNA glycosylase family 4
MMDALERETLLAWLDWQVAMGAEAAVDGEPTDWLARGPAVPGASLELSAALPTVTPSPSPPAPRTVAHIPTATPTNTPQRPAYVSSPPASAPIHAVVPTAVPSRSGTAPPAARQFPTAQPDAAEATARRLARSAASLAELQRLLDGFDGCALKATAKSLCFYRGAETARVMLIGEAPGRDEDIEGRPFVGRAGQLLDKMLKAAGLTEADCHITNVVYWRPPGNRTPTPQEVQVCRPFLERQVELVAPQIIVALGGAAAKAILEVTEGITKVRGKWHDVAIANHKARALATLHPAFLLRTPAAKRQAWRDLLSITEERAAQPGAGAS